MHSEIKKRKIYLMVLILLAICILLMISTTVWENRKYYLTSFLMAILMMVPFVWRFEHKKPNVRELVLLATMIALAVVGRAAFSWFPQCKPVCAIIILVGIALNPEAGFIAGAAAALISNFFFGQGPWTPWQMLGTGLVGFIGGLLFNKKKVKLFPLLLYGFFSVLLIYGLLLDTASLLMFPSEISWEALLAMYISGIVFNLVHAIATVLFLWLLKKAILSKLDRLQQKYELD